MNRLVAVTFAAAAIGFSTGSHAAEIYNQPLSEEPAPFDEVTDSATAGLDRLYNLASSLPEPMNWAMMIIGFGAAGQILRRRRELGHF